MSQNHASSNFDIFFLLLAICFGVDTAPAQDSGPRKIAFLVGVNDYKNKKLDDLQFAENDVTVVAQQLENLGFKTTVLTGRRATQADIKRELDSFIKIASDLESDDIVFAMFSGHGQELESIIERKQYQRGELTTVKRLETIPYFCARDAIPFDKTRHLLRGKTESQIADEFKLISLNRLIGRLDKDSNSLRNLLIVDACRNDPSKGAGKAANISGSTVNELPTGLSILFAAKSGQKSWESSDPNIKHGVMTHFLIEGLQGKAMDQQRGVFTWGDLTNYVQKNVIFNGGALAGGPDRTQNPHSIDSNSDVIVLGRSLAVPLLSAPFDKQTIESAITALGRGKGMKPAVKNDIGMEFRLIPAGKFMMGSPESEDGHGKNDYQHEVEITQPFYMGTYEVTQAQWERVMGDNPSWFSPSGGGAHHVQGMRTGNFPVEEVSWQDTQKFIKRLNRDFAVTGYRYRLPTEAEWEYACRAGSETVFHFGDVLTGKGANCDGNYPYGTKKKGPFLNRTTKVGSYKANGFGLHDMSGNVDEWCNDWYDFDYYNVSPLRDPTGPPSGSSRVLRGGSWNYYAIGCRSANRSNDDPTWRNRDIGFRVVLVR